jgi:hypothetical protein
MLFHPMRRYLFRGFQYPVIFDSFGFILTRMIAVISVILQGLKEAKTGIAPGLRGLVWVQITA